MIKRYFIFPLSIFLYLNGMITAFAFTGPDTFSDLAESVSPSVVNISTTGVIEQTGPEVPSIEDFFNFPFNMPRSEPSEREFSSLGSGFVISEDGFIVTNNHVVENASDIQVTFTDGTKIEAELIAADAETDLALLKVDTNNLDYLEFGDSDTAKVGNWVMAIGNPHGLGGTVTAGIVSARGRMLGGRYDDLVNNFGNYDAPATGISIGLDRLVYALMQKKEFKIKQSKPVVICVFNKNLMSDYIDLQKILRDAEISTEIYPGEGKLKKQMEYANKINAPAVILYGEDEIKLGKPTIRNLSSGKEKSISTEEIVNEIKKII